MSSRPAGAVACEREHARASLGRPLSGTEDGSMGDPFDRVASTINRDLAWLAGGLAALGGALVISGCVAVDVLVRRHRDRPKPTG